VFEGRTPLDDGRVRERPVVALVQREPREARVDGVEQADRVALAQLVELVHPPPFGLRQVRDGRQLVLAPSRAPVLEERVQQQVAGPLLAPRREPGQQEPAQVPRQLVEVVLVPGLREHLRGRGELRVHRVALLRAHLGAGEQLLELGLLAAASRDREAVGGRSLSRPNKLDPPSAAAPRRGRLALLLPLQPQDPAHRRQPPASAPGARRSPADASDLLASAAGSGSDTTAQMARGTSGPGGREGTEPGGNARPARGGPGPGQLCSRVTPAAGSLRKSQ
jgi:hypothetical protein